MTWSFTTDTPDTTSPTVTGRTPAVGATGVALGVSPTATFSEAVQQATITLELRGPGNTLVPATMTYDAPTRIATLDPSGSLASNTTYTVNLSGARDASGNQMQPVSWSFTTTAVTSGCPCTIWPSTAVPAGTDGDTNSVELGVKFRASNDGFVTGIRYYRPSQATGTHVGSLWSRTGTRLGQVTFTGGTASGWQEATFASPIPVVAGTTYVASYYTPSRYVANSAYFATSATTRGPLTALQNGTDGGNGLYRYTSTPSTFPDQSFNSENYWVDVVFEDGPDTTKPTVTARTPAPGATAVSVGANVTATFSEPVQQSTLGLELRGPGGTLVTGATTYDAATRTATLDPAANLAATTTYTATVTGVRDTAGNLIDPVSWTFTTDTPDTTKPTLSARRPRPRGGRRVDGDQPDRDLQRGRPGRHDHLRAAHTGRGARRRDHDLRRCQPHGDPRPDRQPGRQHDLHGVGQRRPGRRRQPDGPGVLDVHHRGHRVELPLHDLAVDRDPGGHRPGHQLGRARREVPDRHPRLRHRDPLLPAQPGHRHPRRQPVDLDRHPARAGHVQRRPASGWQEATFGSPLAVSREHDVRRLVLHAEQVRREQRLLRSAATTRGPLTALQNGTDGGNGLYRYTSTPSTFPNLSFGSENYWVDVVFQEDSTDTTPPTLNSRVPTPMRPASRWESRPQATFSESVTGSTVSMVLRGPGGQVVPSSTAYDTGTRTATLTPSIDLGHSTSYSVEVSGARDGANNTMSPVSWSFQTSAPPPPGIEDGPGGPIAVVTSTGNPSSSYLVGDPSR